MHAIFLGFWSDVTEATNPYVVGLTNSVKFFRLHSP
jgi:hypothetical protein